MSAVCRRMTLADVPQVHAIEERTFATPWSYQSFVDEMTTNKCARYLVAEEDGRVIAYAGAWLIFEEGHITNIAVGQHRPGHAVQKPFQLGRLLQKGLGVHGIPPKRLSCASPDCLGYL